MLTSVAKRTIHTKNSTNETNWQLVKANKCHSVLESKEPKQTKIKTCSEKNIKFYNNSIADFLRLTKPSARMNACTLNNFKQTVDFIIRV